MGGAQRVRTPLNAGGLVLGVLCAPGFVQIWTNLVLNREKVLLMLGSSGFGADVVLVAPFPSRSHQAVEPGCWHPVRPSLHARVGVASTS